VLVIIVVYCFVAGFLPFLEEEVNLVNDKVLSLSEETMTKLKSKHSGV